MTAAPMPEPDPPESLTEWAARLAAAAPPLTEEQCARLRAILRPGVARRGR